MQRTKPPFRADHDGSLLRKQTRAEGAGGRQARLRGTTRCSSISRADLAHVENDHSGAGAVGALRTQQSLAHQHDGLSAAFSGDLGTAYCNAIVCSFAYEALDRTVALWSRGPTLSKYLTFLPT
jgi:hypothetical protein